MQAYAIEYEFEGKHYFSIEKPTKGWESNFLQNVLNRIESITNSGGVVTALFPINC